MESALNFGSNHKMANHFFIISQNTFVGLALFDPQVTEEVNCLMKENVE